MEDHSKASVDRTLPAAASQQGQPVFLVLSRPCHVAWSVVRKQALALFLNAGKKEEDVEKILRAAQLTMEEPEQ